MPDWDVLIVGAGFAGAVCAEQLAAAGRVVQVIDARGHLGGNAYDEVDSTGVLVHTYGAHIFHTNSIRIWEYLSRFTAWRAYEHRVLAEVLIGGRRRLVPVPINLRTVRAFGGDLTAARAAIYGGYTRKQWGPYADELDDSVLARVKIRANNEDRYFVDTFQGIPLAGYAALFARLLESPRIRIDLKTSYADLLRAGLTGGPTIYTGPIDEFFDYRLGRLPYRSARFDRWSFRVTHHTLEEPLVQPVGVINYPDAEVGWTRAIEFRHLTGQRDLEFSTVAREFPTATGDPFWPVKTAASAALRAQYLELARLEAPSVHFLGRLGTFQYLDMHQVIGQALALSARLLDRPEGEISMSPTPVPMPQPRGETMTFPAALELLVAGLHLTRRAWANPEEYLLVSTVSATGLPTDPVAGGGHEYLAVHHADGRVHCVTLLAADLRAEDWAIVREN